VNFDKNKLVIEGRLCGWMGNNVLQCV